MRNTLLLIAIFISTTVFSQLNIGGIAGVSGYIGDLNDKPLKRVKPAISLSLGYQVDQRLNILGTLSLAKIEGGDQYSGTAFLKQNRNLSFTSNLLEGSLVAEYTLFNLDRMSWSPYAFAGLAAFIFNPYVIDSGQKVFLKYLTTEGQGLPEYPDRKFYSRLQMAVPFGGGIKFLVNDKTTIGVELGFRKLFTDYLDDVSSTYVDGNLLLQERGTKSYELSYRGIGAGTQYPVKGDIRGNSKTKDWYYFTGLRINYKLFTSDKGGRGRGGYGCPTNVL